MPSRFPVCIPLALGLVLAAPSVARAQGIPDEPRVPLQTAVTELTRFRAEYSDNLTRRDVKALVAMYEPDAIVVRADATTISGTAALEAWLTERTVDIQSGTVKSDTLRVFGNTAIDVGATTIARKGGGETVTRYLIVLRRGMKDWKVFRVALVAKEQ
jgi:ketosteroid isomerase-like protein